MLWGFAVVCLVVVDMLAARQADSQSGKKFLQAFLNQWDKKIAEELVLQNVSP